MAVVERIQSSEKNQGKVYDLACQDCVRKTKHRAIKSVELFQKDDDPPFCWSELYQIVQCQGCEKISFREGFYDDENFEAETWSAGADFTVVVHPHRIAGRKSLPKAYLLPGIVSKIYEETQSALCSSQPVLAGIGIRALIECLCKEKNAAGSNLEKKIDNLVTIGVLTAVAADILHRLRILGNESAHEIKEHDETTLYTAMDIVETVLSNVYILPQVANSLGPKSTRAVD